MGNAPRCLSALMATALLAGCSGDGPASVSGSTQEATVKGIVTIQGKPAKEGEIIFDPSNIKRKDAAPRRTKIEKDGSFTITTLVGDNTATVEGAQIKKMGLIMRNRKPVDVKSGENSVTITIP